MKTYDFTKAKQLIEANIETITEASLGMHEDWFWTAAAVWNKEDGFLKEIEGPLVAGIDDSVWATPTLQLVHIDGTDTMLPCYITDGVEADAQLKAERSNWANGVISGPVQASITPLTEPPVDDLTN